MQQRKSACQGYSFPSSSWFWQWRNQSSCVHHTLAACNCCFYALLNMNEDTPPGFRVHQIMRQCSACWIVFKWRITTILKCNRRKIFVFRYLFYFGYIRRHALFESYLKLNFTLLFSSSRERKSEMWWVDGNQRWKKRNNVSFKVVSQSVHNPQNWNDLQVQNCGSVSWFWI